MLTIRRFEERVAEDYKDMAVPGLVHSYIGEEACATGVCAALRPDDRIVSTHRGHGHCIAKGADLNRMMAELYGRATGYCQGKGGSMHIADFGIGMLGANGIVGGGFGIATGAALACKLEGSGRVAVAFFGDGATHEGTFHENMNLASIWRLPIVFACENNLYGSTVPATYAIPVKDIAQRAAAYAIPAQVVDGNDVLAVYEKAREAVGRARSGGGPSFLELKTYRWRTHTEALWPLGDPRPKDEVESWKKRDPVPALGNKMIEAEIVSKEELEKIDEEIRAKIKGAINFALESPYPEPQAALANLFSE
ncbi:MAG: thiamine pyrophosphate-dependent dehydrogenase E1 component subunit alpha [Chloroflexota bacterium]